MNLITAFVIGFLVLLAIHVIYYLVVSDNIDAMKRNIRDDIKMLDFEDVLEYLAAWLVCSAVLWAVVNVCGLFISFFIAADINFFELIFDAVSYDSLTHINLTALNLTTLS